MLKENKERGKHSYLVGMQLVGPTGLSKDYFQVLVDPRRGGDEAVFITAYSLNSQQWMEYNADEVGPHRPTSK